MSRISYLAKNIGFLTISSFGTKLLPFFLLPLYTTILTTNDYGRFDIINTTVSLVIPIFTLGLSSSVLRYAMEEGNDKKAVFSYGLKYFLLSSCFVGITVLLNELFFKNAFIKQNSLFIFLFFASSTLYGFVSQFSRGLENIQAVAIASVFGTVVIAMLNILFLNLIRMGLTGYLIANILGIFLQTTFLFIMAKLWRYVSFRKISPVLKREMRSYAAPLVVNDVSWWVNNLSDRYVITWLCGMSANGIYSIAYKIPSVLTMTQNIFAQAWTLSAIKEYNSEDASTYFSKMYSFYNFAMVLLCSGIIILTRFLARILYAKDFYEAWHYVPFLLISVVFGSLAGYIGAIFGALKVTKTFAYSSVTGAITNIALNIILVQKIGIEGAALATLASYCLIWLLRILTIRKYITLKIHYLKNTLCFFLLAVQAVLLLSFENSFLLYVMEIAVFTMIILLNFDILKMLFLFFTRGKHDAK